MKVRKLKIICDNVMDTLKEKTPKVIKKDKYIKLITEDSFVSSYLFELKKIAKKHGIEDINKMEMFYQCDENYSAEDDSGIYTVVQVDYELSDKELEKIYNRRFENRLWKIIYEEFTNLGYKRVGFDSRDFKEFDDTSVYKMYKNKEFDRLLKYYSLKFKKNLKG
jgi:hypothetical protein